ncbi:LysR family transcriptional regulator [Paraburkholderia tropica]|uniref:LysR family transcriptional regulator n=1 Tax=Paraburkholderia tropica TaxID=92647 RepID=A0A1A5XI58_9BURK|nr:MULTISPECIES: LysR family transcriptional regulator [Paraburkholderia]MBB2980204.1 DNA-binding transcriptional LysR family regulator [Paraburkholderia tropica]MBB3001238.1 DNA-binding transcriptional LysR family regulator [Paraburkholderia tropica]MBB6320870.1 DNA-binding transcriptional LysR family regulator [Paraburkholderia tropica]MDE1140685.1 LysR family transcriptional regulator [Paraburkholderia tropica]OBR52788.1 LysR family transcriptional regulator [Paraburkholderia tropica]
MTTPTELPDLKLLQLFDLLYDTRSVTRVAEQLGQSQPTVSIWLARLREHLHDPLFIRTPAGMAPTPQADALIGPCREILESLRRFSAWEIAFDPATAQRRFRICMTDASHVTLLPRLLAHVRAQAPGVRLEAARIDGNTERALESGEADLAIGYVPWLSGGIYQQQLYEQDWVCLANRHHPRIRKRLSVKAYRSEGHVAITAGTGTALLEQALVRERIERQIALELPGFLGLGAIVQTTDLITTLPRHIGETLAQASDLAVHACPIPVDGFAVRQHWHARYHHEAGNRWLRSVVARLFGAAGNRLEG